MPQQPVHELLPFDDEEWERQFGKLCPPAPAVPAPAAPAQPADAPAAPPSEQAVPPTPPERERALGERSR